MSLIFLNRYFYPDHSATSQLLSDLVFSLAEDGQQITVITSRLRYDDDTAWLPQIELVNGVKIVRLDTSRFGRVNLLGRAIDYLTFYLASMVAIWRECRPGDVVVAKTDPPILAVAIGPIVRRRRALFVNWLQDLFPEVAEVLGVGPGFITKRIFRLLRSLRNRELKKAVMTVAIGELMAKRLRKIGLPPHRVRVIPNWADGSVIHPVAHPDNSLRTAWDLQDAFVVGYSGNLGRAHDVMTIVDAIDLLESSTQPALKETSSTDPKSPDPASAAISQVPVEPNTVKGNRRVVWVFIGGGAGLSDLKREVAKRRLMSVRFYPYQPRALLSESLSAADLHLVSLMPDLEGLIVPSKYYGIAAAGRPTLFIGSHQGEISLNLKRIGAGETVAPGDGVKLAAAVMEFANRPTQRLQAGRNARTAFEAEFDRPAALLQWRSLLRELSVGADTAN